MTSLSSFLSLLKYSGFQQSADKCNACGHLIMDMVSVCFFSPAVCTFVCCVCGSEPVISAEMQSYFTLNELFVGTSG